MEATFDICLEAIRDHESRAIEQQDAQDEMAARDAQQLLRTFAFMHREKIRFDFLKRCAEGSVKEQALEEAERKTAPQTAQTWTEYLAMRLHLLLDKPRRHPVSTTLPDVLRQARISGSLDEHRLRAAMRYLRRYSLVSHDEKTDSWSMHPLVQRWAREGCETNVGEHHVWCEAAATVLSSCVILGEAIEGNEELMAHLLPHVSEVRRRQRELEQRITGNRMGRDRWYPVLDWGVKSNSLLMYAKFSIVYLCAGQYEQAEELQRVVHRAVEPLLGYKSVKTRRITIAWARTLWALGRADEQAKLLEKLLDNCMEIFGPDHRDTYVASIKLADARLQQGRVLEARLLCEHSVPGLEKNCGDEDEETLEALNVFAKAILLTGTPGAVTRAREYYQQTWRTRERLLGAEHVSTLDSRQLFYATSFWDGKPEGHMEAKKGMEEIVELLIRIRGREHPLTLLAMLYLARIKVELHDFEGAQELFDYGLPIAIRELNEDHMAVLFCRYHVGRMRVRQERWSEARDVLVDVSQRQSVALQGWGRFHYDRIGSLLELARAHHELGEDDMCDAVVHEAFEGFKRITASVHPWEKRLRDQWEDWKKHRKALTVIPKAPLCLTV